MLRLADFRVSLAKRLKNETSFATHFSLSLHYPLNVEALIQLCREPPLGPFKFQILLVNCDICVCTALHLCIYYLDSCLLYLIL